MVLLSYNNFAENKTWSKNIKPWINIFSCKVTYLSLKRKLLFYQFSDSKA